MNYKKPLVWAAALLLLGGSLRAGSLELTHGKVDAGNPRWSPDGRWIAFVGEQDDGRGLFIVPSDGDKPAERLVANIPGSANFAWRPDSGAMVYSARIKGKPWVCTVDLHTRQTSPLAEGANPVYSPDGKVVAFVTRQDVMTISPADGKVVNLTRQPRLSIMQRLCWSRDGKHIYYARDGDLWTVDADGKNNRRLVDHMADGATSPIIADPAAGADGKRVFYSLLTEGLYAGFTHNLVGYIDLETGQAHTLCEADGWSLASSGQALVVSVGGQMSLRVKFDAKATPLGDGFYPAMDPMGKRVAYCIRSDFLGAARILVRTVVPRPH